MFGLEPSIFILFIACVVCAIIFEFINGFHDTANAVATVIYTRTLKPRIAVLWSGLWNFLGVYLGGITVAMAIMHLLPLDVLIEQSMSLSVSLILTLLITAIIWNIGTWYLGLPCSSSHTLLGSIFGASLALAYVTNTGVANLPWKKLEEAGLSLLVSPLFGFFLAIGLMFLFSIFVKKKRFFAQADKNKKPPFLVRLTLILTCTSVSFAHGSNDGQKGVGLMMIILICFLPAKFAIDPAKNPASMGGNLDHIMWAYNKVDYSKIPVNDTVLVNKSKHSLIRLKEISSILSDPEVNTHKYNFEIRKNILILESASKVILSTDPTDARVKSELKQNIKQLKSYTEFVPWWVMLLVSLSLGMGTMIGWKRIVVTIGEKIGKKHLSYAQGASAEIVAASTIAVSTMLGLPVSTTHVLSSGIAGAMSTRGGIKNIQADTVKSILLAWALTIPVAVIISGGLFLFINWILK
ncbi:MAG: inorganic phosphate transporter [Bacteroidales bacterium]|jgi:PiT family inorganic phosphate transporter